MSADTQAEAILAGAKAMAPSLRKWASICVTGSVEQVRALAGAAGVDVSITWYAAGELACGGAGPQVIESAKIPLGDDVTLMVSAARPAVEGDRELAASREARVAS